MTGNTLAPVLEKCPTGITGFDDISYGGLPRGRPTLLAGTAGSGKTLFALEFILHGIEQYNEPGVFVSFEETPEELTANVLSLGHDLEALQREQRLSLLYIALDPHELLESGEYDLDGIFLRLGAAIRTTGARRIVLDAVENLFSAFSDLRILRAEFRRLMAWLKDQGISAIVTTERGTETLTRHGLEEYIADCVVSLDNRVENQLATRRLRIVKYRGSTHDTDECPFVLNRYGFAVIPVTASALDYEASSERVSFGIANLDEMLGGGIYRGSSALVSGSAGTGKSSMAIQLVDAACRRGERCLYVALEESPEQIQRNMASVGFDLAQWRRAGLLHFHATRPTSCGLEAHLATLVGLVREIQPKFVVIDPITAYSNGRQEERAKLMLIRAVDLFKSQGITSLFTALTPGGNAEESTSVSISSIIDVWMLVRNLELAGERTRGLYVCKARGGAHSNQIREFLLTDEGPKLIDVMLNDEGQIVTGSARKLHQSLRDDEANARRANEAQRRAIVENRRHVMEAKISAMQAEYAQELHLLEAALADEFSQVRARDRTFTTMASLRNKVTYNE